MLKKTCTFITILAFIFFDWACVVHSVSNDSVSSVIRRHSQILENIQILGVVKKTGEYIQFPEEKPATIIGDLISGQSGGNRGIPLSVLRSFKKNKDGVVSELTTLDGMSMTNIQGRLVGGKIVVPSPGSFPVSIPVSEVEMVWVRRVNFAGTFLATISVIAGPILVCGLIIAALKESCPFS